MVRDAISEIAAILGGIAPLTKNVKSVRERLAKLRAGRAGAF